MILKERNAINEIEIKGMLQTKLEWWNDVNENWNIINSELK